MPRKTHGWGGTSEYHTWHTMWQRCHNTSATSYENYGGRGIHVCARWADFESFLADVGPKPSPSHTLDRLSNDRGYEPGNVRWATLAEQGHNRRTNLVFTHDGFTGNVTQWATRPGVPRHRIYSRLKRGKSFATAISE